jgi:hypothetical protein
MAEIGDVAAELNDQWLVEAELDADLLDRLFVRGGACEISRWIAGQGARQQKGDDDHPDQIRDDQHHAP